MDYLLHHLPFPVSHPHPVDGLNQVKQMCQYPFAYLEKSVVVFY